MIDTAALHAAGTSPAAIAQHYDLSDDFFRLWLGTDLVYSCGLWHTGDDVGSADGLARAQQRKLDFFAERLRVAGARVLDVGCGWGALLDRFVRVHGAESGVGLTLSTAQERYATSRQVPGAQFRRLSWVDHEPAAPYHVITAIESTEHFASDALSSAEKVDVYRAFFDRVASWLVDFGRVGLQLICLDGVGHDGSRPGRGPFSELIGRRIFPESMPASLSEMVLGWETWFQLDEFFDHTDHYRRTFRAWALRYRAEPDRVACLVDPDVARAFGRYFAAGEYCFRTREHGLYRVTLTKRPAAKSWAILPQPARTPGQPAQRPAGTPGQPAQRPAGTPGQPAQRPAVVAGASPAAIQYHYDLSNDFYALWLGPTMMYSSGLWAAGDPPDLEAAHERKIDYFATRILDGTGQRLLDVGCGWGGTMRRMIARHGVAEAVGLTLSPAQAQFVAEDPPPGMAVQLQAWAAHRPSRRYDAIVSFGAFEHFARDGTRGPERVLAYQAFFARCYDWLVADGQLGLETIAHDDAADTDRPLGRGPLGDFVLGLFPESICPHLGELVLGFEPWFEVEVLRADGADFARTFRTWQIRLRDRADEAGALVGADTVRRFRRYLAASEAQFRTRALTNYRLVLRRRPVIKR